MKVIIAGTQNERNYAFALCPCSRLKVLYPSISPLTKTAISFIHSRYFYSASSVPLLLRGTKCLTFEETAN